MSWSRVANCCALAADGPLVLSLGLFGDLIESSAAAEKYLFCYCSYQSRLNFKNNSDSTIQFIQTITRDNTLPLSTGLRSEINKGGG